MSDTPPRKWTMPRAEMACAASIRSRMAADMVRLAEERTGVETWHLVDLGWTPAQVARHAEAAAAGGPVQLGAQAKREARYFAGHAEKTANAPAFA